MDTKELMAELQGLGAIVREKGDLAEAEAKKYGEATAETKVALEKINERMSNIEIQFERKAAAGAAGESGEREVKASAIYSRASGRQVSPEQAKAHDVAFWDFVRHGKAAMAPEQRKNLVEDATGELIVPYDLEAGVYRVLPQLNVLRPLVGLRTTIRDRILARSITEVATGWGKLETGTAITTSAQVPTQTYIYVEDLYGLTKIGEDELMDTDIALSDIVANSFGIAIANDEENAIVGGLGHASQQPQGLVGAGVGVDGTSVIDVTAAASGAISADDLIGLEFALKPQYARRGVYLVNRSTASKMRQLKDSNGQHLWIVGGVTAGNVPGTPATFNGYPVYQSVPMPVIPASGTAGTGVAFFADLADGYVFVERLGMTLQRLNELYAESGMVGFKVHRRCGGAVVRGEAIAQLNTPV